MGRKPLGEQDVEAFRERACDAALELFAVRGYDGFSLRELGRSLGCSATLPYRYFADRDAIFAAVRDRGFARLAADAARAIEGTGDPIRRFRAQAHAYVQFAQDNPSLYRIMFGLARPMRRPLPCEPTARPTEPGV